MMRHVFPRLVLFRDFRVVVRVDAARDDAGPDGRGVRDARWTHILLFTLCISVVCVHNECEETNTFGIRKSKTHSKEDTTASFDTLNIHFDTLNFDRRKKKEIKKNDSFEEGKRA